jgi:NADPH:quinone reductase-like Zn-dependent oxidoreductase
VCVAVVAVVAGVLAGFYGVNMKRIGDNRPDILRSELVEILALFESGKLFSHVTQVMNWHRIGEAHQAMESRATSGKIVLFVAAADVTEFVEPPPTASQ